MHSSLHALIDVPVESVDEMCAFWSAVTGWPAGDPRDGHPGIRSLIPPDDHSYVHLQRIFGPPRVHLALASRNVASDRAAHVQLGATALEPHPSRQVMASPGGLPYRLLAGDPQRRPPAATRWQGGHRSRIVQFCVDVPAAVFDAEVEFWGSATGWPAESTRLPEFARLTTPATSPLRFLLQRLGPGDRGPVRAHVDLGTDDLVAEVDRIQRLGARLRATHRWAVMTDPVGLPFCVSPELSP